MNLGFIGLGGMGQPMAINLLRAGHRVAVYNRTRARAEQLDSEGARVADSPADAARDADAVITMLADDHAVEQIVFGEGNLLSSLAHGAAHISMSTISVEFSKRLGQAHGSRGQVYLAAPVFGRPEAAAEKKLWVIASGEKQQVERFHPVFEAVGRGVTVLGPEPWQANVVKVSGNFLIASMLEALGEAFALVEKSGIAPRQFLDAVNSALFNSPLYANYGARVADGAFRPPGFRLQLGLKDARLTLQAAESATVPMPLAGLIHDHMLAAIAHGQADADWSAFAKVASQMAGITKAAHGD